MTPKRFSVKFICKEKCQQLQNETAYRFIRNFGIICKEKCQQLQNEIAYRFIRNFGIIIVLLLRTQHKIRTLSKKSNNIAIKKIFQSNNKLL